MKIALCISGQPRTMEYCFASIKKHILDIYHPDVFICSDEQEEKIKELYNPVAIEMCNQEEVNKIIGGKVLSYSNFQTQPIKDLSAMWKGKRVEELRVDWEKVHGKYDVVLMTRFDIKFLEITPITLPEPSTLYMPIVDALLTNPDAQGRHFGGYSSQLCWCSSDVANIMLTFYDESDQLYNQLGNWHAEIAFKQFCDNHRIVPKLVNISMMIVRGTNEHPLATDLCPMEKYPQFLGE